ncbi:MAG: flagellar motor switch protein FliG [Verrucomicrobiota bacterium]|jgi:flagellar motor switch protein FliG
MESTFKAELESSAEFAKLTKTQKLAAFLLMLSQENAAHLLKSLEEQELEDVSSEMFKMGTVSQEMQHEILREFSSVAVEAATAINGGMDRVKELLEKSVGLFRASDIIGRVSPHRELVGAMQQIVEMDTRHIFSLLHREQLQTIVLVISYLSQEKASQLLALFPQEMREQIIERLATMAPTSVQVVENVAQGLQSKFGSNRTRSFNQTGGVRVAAQMLNHLPQNMSKSILTSLSERNAELGEAILKKMFTFEELDRLDGRTLQVILQDVDMRLLAVALKTASEKLKKALLSCISKRAAENILEEISFMGPLRLNEIDAAKSQILETVRRLEAEGEISLDELRQKSRLS